MITLLLLPLEKLTRTWEKSNLGERVARLLVDLVLIVHIVRTFLR